MFTTNHAFLSFTGSLCGHFREDSLHLLQECNHAQIIWKHFWRDKPQNIVWNADISEWIAKNMCPIEVGNGRSSSPDGWNIFNVDGSIVNAGVSVATCYRWSSAKFCNKIWETKEIPALCWAFFTGSIVAVGYLAGDILLWNLSSAAPSKGQHNKLAKGVVKLPFFTVERRQLVIILQWSKSYKIECDCVGQLFVYGEVAMKLDLKKC
ncbi:hypothetical protein VNO78_15556 [Psophocarpus tetragonolobus]|uniref:Uncharacterized protein n=1 Tax=Psophocarpus tetragonolobus TaxID=3891 RepID=A0AAN9SF73_PSOTE